MPPANILDGDLAVPNPTTLGWDLKVIAGTYATVTTLCLAEIYESLSGEKGPIAGVKELSDRIGRLTVLFIDQTSLNVYTPQRYQHFQPLALTYCSASKLFGMVAHRESHHDYICYLCAYLIRIENVADVPGTILHAYIAQATKASEDITKLKLLERGKQELEEKATELEGCHIFGQAIQDLQQIKEEVSRHYVTSQIQQKFTCKKLSLIDTDGVAFATELLGFLKLHGGDVALVQRLLNASRTVVKELDVLMGMPAVNPNTLTDNLLGSMKSKADLVGREFTEKMKPYICVENDIYTWSTLSSMESGDVSLTYQRHITFSLYKKKRGDGDVQLVKLMRKINKVTPIGMDIVTNSNTVTQYNRSLKIIADLMVQTTQNNNCLPDMSVFQRRLEAMIQRGLDYDAVFHSLTVCGLLEFDVNDSISIIVDRLIAICEEMPLQRLMSVALGKLLAVGTALHTVGRQTKLQNAHFDLQSDYRSIMHVLLCGDHEQALQVKFIKKDIDTSITTTQPWGNTHNSPFTTALAEWTALMTKVQRTAKNMTEQMLKFNDFTAENPKLLLSRKLHPVHEYELFTKQIQLWNITDTATMCLQNTMCENLKLVRIFAEAFPDQESEQCASMRSFTSNTDLTYTLSERDSILGAIIAQSKTPHMLHDFKATHLKCVDLAPLAFTYTPQTIPLPVKDIETLLHYLFSVYERNGHFGSILYHLSVNGERVALLEHITTSHVKVTGEDEGDEVRVGNICQRYMRCFEQPYRDYIACIDHEKEIHGSSVWKVVDMLLCASSVHNNIIANRMIQGADIYNTTVTLGEFARAVGGHRLYILTHCGETLAWGDSVSADTHTVVLVKEWREKIINRLISSNWDVNIREIIGLHTGLYQPAQKSVENEGSTFFLDYVNGAVCVCEVMLSLHTKFPNESHANITFGGVQFSNSGHLPISQPFNGDIHTNFSTERLDVCKSGSVKDYTPVLQEYMSSQTLDLFADAFGKISLDAPQSPHTLTSNKGPNSGIPAPENDMIAKGAECDRKEVVCVDEYHEQQPRPRATGIDQACTAIPSTHNTPSTDTHTLPNQERSFMGYRAKVNPWNIFINERIGVDNAMFHLVQETIQLPSSSEGSDEG